MIFLMTEKYVLLTNAAFCRNVAMYGGIANRYMNKHGLWFSFERNDNNNPGWVTYPPKKLPKITTHRISASRGVYVSWSGEIYNVSVVKGLQLIGDANYPMSLMLRSDYEIGGAASELIDMLRNVDTPVDDFLDKLIGSRESTTSFLSEYDYHIIDKQDFLKTLTLGKDGDYDAVSKLWKTITRKEWELINIKLEDLPLLDIASIEANTNRKK